MDISDVLFYADLRRSVVPTIGGLPAFTRNSIAFGKSIEALERTHVIDTPRINPDGLLLELAHTNELPEPFDLENAAWADGGGAWTSAVVTSRYNDKTAIKYTNTSISNHNRNDAIGSYTTSPETYYVDVENIDTLITSLEMNRAPDNIIVHFTWATATTALGANTGFTSITHGAIKLDEIGPNGGVVYRIWVTGTNTAGGTTRTAYIYPTGQPGNNTTSVVIHAAQHVEDDIFSSAVDGTRAVENFSWQYPQTQRNIARYVKMTTSTGGGKGDSPRIFTNEGPDPDWYCWYDGSMRFQVFSATSAAATITIAQGINPGDVIEVLSILDSSDGSHIAFYRINGGGVTRGSVGAPSGWGGEDWGSTTVSMNGITGGKHVGSWERFVDVKPESLHRASDGSDNEAIMDEMAGLYVIPDGKTIVSSQPFIELATNGTFDTNLTGWTEIPDTGTISWDAGTVFLENANPSVWVGITQAVSLKASKVYVLSVERTFTSGASGNSRAGVDTQGTVITSLPDQVGSRLAFGANVLGVLKTQFTVSSDDTYYIHIVNAQSSPDLDDKFDNISLKEFDS